MIDISLTPFLLLKIKEPFKKGLIMQSQERSLDFSGETFYIGLDIHKRKWVVSIRNNKTELKTFSMDPNPEQLNHYMKKNYPGGRYVSAYEAGYFGFWIHRKLEQFGFKNIVFNAADIPTSHKEKVTKTDPIDSRKIARELENGSLREIYIPDEFHQQLRSLCRLRGRHVRHQTRIKNRIKGHLSIYGIHIPEGIQYSNWSARFINWLRQLEFYHKSARDYLDICLDEYIENRSRIARITHLLRGYIKENRLSDLIKNLCTIPGVAFVTAITFYTEIMDINRFADMDHFCSYVGLVPSLHNSGEKESGRGITKRRNSNLRHLIDEASWVAIRKDPAMLMCFNDFCKRMRKQEAIIRIAKKLLRRMRHVWKNEKSYVYAVVA